MRVRVFLILCLLLGSKGFCLAGESEGELIPDGELLEFLGTWVNDSEEWIDPLFFDDGLHDDVETKDREVLERLNSSEGPSVDPSGSETERGKRNE